MSRSSSLQPFLEQMLQLQVCTAQNRLLLLLLLLLLLGPKKIKKLNIFWGEIHIERKNKVTPQTLYI